MTRNLVAPLDDALIRQPVSTPSATGAPRSSARVDDLARFLGEHDLLDGADRRRSSRRCASGSANEKLVVAFVAEFSRGKSELINAIFFADTGRRILPATPGRTTMCPVELG